MYYLKKIQMDGLFNYHVVGWSLGGKLFPNYFDWIKFCRVYNTFFFLLSKQTAIAHHVFNLRFKL